MNITLNRRQEVRLIEIGLGTLLGNLSSVEEPVVKKASKKKVKKSRRKMTDSQRKAVSQRMRKYWAERRKPKK